MLQAKFSITPSEIQFLDNHTRYGFKDKSSMVRSALEYFKQELEYQRLKESADIYAEVYAEDQDLQEMTASASEEWPE